MSLKFGASSTLTPSVVDDRLGGTPMPYFGLVTAYLKASSLVLHKYTIRSFWHRLSNVTVTRSLSSPGPVLPVRTSLQKTRRDYAHLEPWGLFTVGWRSSEVRHNVLMSDADGILPDRLSATQQRNTVVLGKRSVLSARWFAE